MQVQFDVERIKLKTGKTHEKDICEFVESLTAECALVLLLLSIIIICFGAVVEV